MTQNKEDLKNKIMYRASYRGAKEIDILLISFVKKYINSLKNEDLVDLCNFLSIDDENIFKNYPHGSLQTGSNCGGSIKLSKLLVFFQ